MKPSPTPSANRRSPIQPNGPTRPVQVRPGPAGERPAVDRLGRFQPIPISSHQPQSLSRSQGGCSRPLGCGCLPLALLLVAALVYFLVPFRTNLLVLGIDRAPEGTFLGRSDTIILVSVSPLKPDVRMLSVPRDLWVAVPGYGENRINTPHFFAEAEREGSGPAAAQRAIEENFGVSLPYYVRVRFDAFTQVVEAMGGIDLELAETMAGYPPGEHHLNGEQALAFARDRAGTDDFFRMANGQFLLKAAARQLLRPKAWLRLPVAAAAFFRVMDTNLPVWQWPRLGVAILRAGSDGIDNRTLTREMVNPFTTSEGASVLLPNWEAINPVVDEMFGQ